MFDLVPVWQAAIFTVVACAFVANIAYEKGLAKGKDT